MLVRTMTYTDYNGVERTEDFLFNLSKGELTEMELTTEGGLLQKLDTIIKSKDKVVIYNTFKAIILKAYGEKSEDGKRFRKDPELTKAFTETEAFSDLIVELTTDDNAAVAFIEGILPKTQNAD